MRTPLTDDVLHVALDDLRGALVARDEHDVALECARLLRIAVGLVGGGLDLRVDLLERLLLPFRREAALDELRDRRGALKRAEEAGRQKELLRALRLRLDSHDRESLRLVRRVLERGDARVEIVLGLL